MSSNTAFLDLSNVSLPLLECSSSSTSTLILVAYFVTNILLILPLSTLIFYLGYQRWRQQCHSPTAATANSNTDIFTYHIITMEMIMVLGSLLYCVSAYADLPLMMIYVSEIFFSAWSTKIHFHTLTCVEHYLAVVHPVSYLSLKTKSGVRVRNLSIGCVWLCFVCVTLVALISDNGSMILYFWLVVFALLIVCFCCISVLCALRRRGPGEVGRDRERVDKMKQRSFNTIVTIMGVLLLCLAAMLTSNTLEALEELRNNEKCLAIISVIWFSLPSSLVLPLLFLHRAGKLPGCRCNIESG